MDNAIGWLLDVTVERNAATLWIKTTQGDLLRLTDKYQPCFYILQRTEQAGTELFHIYNGKSHYKLIEGCLLNVIKGCCMFTHGTLYLINMDYMAMFYYYSSYLHHKTRVRQHDDNH